MTRFGLAFAVALSVVAVLGLAGPVAAGEQVPFKGSLAGEATVTPLTPPNVAIYVEAAGVATHLGQFELDIPHVVNRGDLTARGYYEFTAANGDKVYAEFTGQGTLTDVPGVVYIEETATITGGTGRFAGATGRINAERWFDTVAGTTTGSFDGTVSAPGS